MQPTKHPQRSAAAQANNQTSRPPAARNRKTAEGNDAIFFSFLHFFLFRRGEAAQARTPNPNTHKRKTTRRPAGQNEAATADCEYQNRILNPSFRTPSGVGNGGKLLHRNRIADSRRFPYHPHINSGIAAEPIEGEWSGVPNRWLLETAEES